MLVALFILFHFGMAIFMRLSTFPFVMIVIWLLFLPSEAWDRFFQRESAQRRRRSTGVRSERGSPGSRWFTRSSPQLTSPGMFYPAASGWQAAWQRAGVELLVYQQWAMFSIPSTLL